MIKKIAMMIFIIIFISCNETESVNITTACDNINCSNHGECGLNNDRSATCICDDGYYVDGINCLENGVEPTCENFACKEHSKCELRDGDPTCICETGYSSNGTLCVEDHNACTDNPCTQENKTKCELTSDSYNCLCNDGYGLEDDGSCKKMEKYRLRLMAANTTTGRYGLYQSDGIRIFKGINPDVIMVQEFLYANKIDELVEKIYGINCLSEKKCYYYQGSRGKPNGIISRYKILKTGYWKDGGYGDRNLDWAIVDIPGDKDLYAISVHLSTKGSEQTAPARMIAKKIAEHKRTYPNKYYYVVGGDFNGTTAARAFTTEAAFSLSDPAPESENCRTGQIRGEGKKKRYKCTNTNMTRRKRYDWIMESLDLSQLRVATKFCNKDNPEDCISYPNSLVFDTREYTSDVMNKYFYPTRLNDSTDQYMQHMAIVKDFEIKF